MKVIKNISFLVFTLLFVLACENDDYTGGPEFSKAGIFSPIGGVTAGNGNPPTFQVNDFVSVGDISQGLVSRQWRIDPENKFLLNTFKPADTLNLEPFIDSRLGNNSNTQEIFVLFKKIGENKITYRGVFNDSTALQALSTNGTNRDAIPAVENEDGLWVLDVELNYIVLDSLKPEVTISNFDDSVVLGTLNPNQFPSRNSTSNFETIEIEAGTTLKFKDITTIGFLEGADAGGRPNTSRVWSFEGGLPDTSIEAEQNVTFNRTGEYIVDINTTRAQKGNSLRFVSRTKPLPYIIKVVPSTQPFSFIDAPFAKDDEDSVVGTKKINLTVNGELESFTGVESNFSLDVTDINGGPITVSVTSARVDPDNASTIVLTLDNSIYNTDTAELSYSSSGSGTDILAVDGRNFEDFSSILVTQIIGNLLPADLNPGFESGVVNPNQANATGWNLFIPAGGNASGNNQIENATGADGGLYVTRATGIASEGIASLKFDAIMPFDSGITFLGLSNTIFKNADIPAGDYKLTYDLYYEPNTDFAGLFTRIVGATPNGNGVEVMTFNPPGTEQWFTVERNISLGASGITGNAIFNFRAANENILVNGRQTFYIDNFQLIAVETRP